jgi:hypothetical protein
MLYNIFKYVAGFILRQFYTCSLLNSIFTLHSMELKSITHMKSTKIHNSCYTLQTDFIHQPYISDYNWAMSSITSFKQAPPANMRYDSSLRSKTTCFLSHLIRTLRSQVINRLLPGLMRLWILYVYSLKLISFNQCFLFNTTWPLRVVIFTSGRRSSPR